MRLLETWVASPLAGAAGWALLHSLWEGAIIAAALAVVLGAMRSPRVRYAAACVAMLMMLGGFGVTLVRMMPEASRGARSALTPAFRAWNVQTGTDAAGPSNPSLSAIAPWLAPFWLAGVCIFYAGHMAGWISVCRMRRRGVCHASDEWQRRLAGLCAQLSVSRPVRLLESCLVDAPMVLGHFRPIILMPIGLLAGLLAGLPAGQIEAILLHELAHIRRYDYLVNVLQRSVEGLMFYHPAIWWMSRVVRTERENCCDDVVVDMSGNAHEYAEALATLEQNRWSGREPAVAATGGSLVKRIRRLLYPQSPNGAWTPLFAAVILMAIAAVTLAGWQAAPAQQSADAAQKQSERAVTPYVKWLNEDVVYIIDDKERATFERLATDEERNKFIEQFWLRRVTPGSSDNKVKEEHYRRIAHANRYFRTASGGPGWQTDRGHMWIVYGPPDEIESHPSGETRTPYPFEDWKYYHVAGIGDNLFVKFVDRTRTGDFRVAPGNGH